MYKVYADYHVNPSKKPSCQIGWAHDTLLEAVEVIISNVREGNSLRTIRFITKVLSYRNDIA